MEDDMVARGCTVGVCQVSAAWFSELRGKYSDIHSADPGANVLRVKAFKHLGAIEVVFRAPPSPGELDALVSPSHRAGEWKLTAPVTFFGNVRIGSTPKFWSGSSRMGKDWRPEDAANGA